MKGGRCLILSSSIAHTRLNFQRFVTLVGAIIYLDSAHEVDETLVELRTAYGVINTPGILFGDDYNWKAVADDLKRFVTERRFKPLPDTIVNRFRRDQWWKTEQPLPGVVLIAGSQWIIPKFPEITVVMTVPVGEDQREQKSL